MEIPITRPSMVSYADEVNFSELIENLLKKRHNGFIRVTSGSEEGYILFKEGQQVAASYERYSKSDAVAMIDSAMENDDTVIEVFDLRSSYVDYIMDVNKPYLMEPDYDVYGVIKELRKPEDNELGIDVKSVPQTEPVTGTEKTETVTGAEDNEPILGEQETEPQEEFESSKATEEEEELLPESVVGEEEELLPESETEEKLDLEDLKEKFDIGTIDDARAEFDLKADKSSKGTEESSKGTKIVSEISESPKESETKTTEQSIQDEESFDESEKQELKPADRSELMEKYGIKEINEDDVDDILESYKGGSLSDDDVEKIELNLMNKIKKSIYGIPKVKGAEVMVFLDNNGRELAGNVNIIIEYESKGFLSRLLGDYKDNDHLRRQVMNIVQIELKKGFRKYPKVFDNFDIKVEIG